MQNKNIIRLALAVAVILLLIWFAMQITGQAGWSAADFALAGALLFGTGLAYELVTRKVGNIAYRAAVGIALAAALLLLWINLAVGIIGSEDNPLNWMYVGVLAVLVTGALIARFRPHGMARALFATALAQAVTTIIAPITVIGLVTENFVDALELVILNGFFVALWAGSSWLFRRANAAQNQELA